jgi:hypothetical protein
LAADKQVRDMAKDRAETDDGAEGYRRLPPATKGYFLLFLPRGSHYLPLSALAVLSGLNAKRFSGVCECYMARAAVEGSYGVGIGLRSEGDGEKIRPAWWRSLVSAIGHACADDDEVNLDIARCRPATLQELRANLHDAGVVQLRDGLPYVILADPNSPFTVVSRGLRDECQSGSPDGKESR